MTLKSYLRMLLAAVTLMFVTTGCNDDEEKVGPPPSYTFGIAVSDVTETEATVTVTPSNDQATYYYGAVKKADFDAFESDAAYAQNILATLKAAADRKVLSLEEYLQTALSKGSSPKKISDLMAGTDYYAVAIGILTDGRFTSDLVKEAFKTVAAPEPAPELTLSMRAGDANGQNTSSYVTCHIESSDITSAKAAFLMKADVDKLLAQGKTLADILASLQKDPSLNAQQVEKINSAGGYDLPCQGVPASTAVTAIVSVTNAAGKTTIDSASASTEAAQGGGDGPELTLTLRAGDLQQANKDSKAYMGAYAPTAVGALYGLFETSQVEAAIGNGATYDTIVTLDGDDMTKEDGWMEYLTTNPGIGVTFNGLKPNTSYTIIVKVTDSAGKSTTKYATASTETAGEPISVEMKNLSHGQMIYYGQAYDNPTLDYADWEVYIADATFDFATGGTGEYMIIELITAKSATTDITPGTYTVAASTNSISNLKAFTCWPGYVGQNAEGNNVMVATWYCNTVTRAQYPISGGTIKVSKSGGNYTFEFDIQSSSMNASVKGTYTGALSYIDATKQSAPARAPWANAANAPKRLVQYAAMQNVVDAQVSVINPLSFVKHAAVYEATISTLQISRSL